MKIHRFVTSSLVAASVFLSTAAYADDPREKQAEPIYLEGVRLFDRHEDARALEKFKEAYGIYPSPIALASIAATEKSMGRLLEAIRHYREVLANPLTHPQTAQRARDAIKQLEQKLGRVVVQARPGTEFVFDGKRYTAPLKDPLDTEVGEVKLIGSFEGTSYEGRATAVAGQTVSLELKAQTQTTSASTPAPAADHHVEPPKETRSEGWSTVRIVTVSGLGAAAVGALVVGFVFNGAAKDDADEAKAVLAPVGGGCLGGTSPQCARAKELQSDHDSHVTLSTLSFVGAGVFAAGAVTAAIFWPRSNSQATTSTSKRARLVPNVTPTTFSADLTLTF